MRFVDDCLGNGINREERSRLEEEEVGEREEELHLEVNKSDFQWFG